MPHASSLLLAGRRVLANIGEAAPEIGSKIGGFGRDLTGTASGFASQRTPLNENKSIVILGLICRGRGMAEEFFPSPETLQFNPYFRFSLHRHVVCCLA